MSSTEFHTFRRFFIPILTLLILLPAMPAAANYTLIPISGVASYGGSEPAIACSEGLGTEVAWVSDGHVWTQWIATYDIPVHLPARDAIEPPVDHGSGRAPALVWTSAGFVLAFLRGSDAVIHTGEHFFDYDSNILATDLDADSEMTLDLWGNGLVADTGIRAHLTVGGIVDDWTDSRILSASWGSDDIWSAWDTVASGLQDNARPQASYHESPTGPLARIYYSADYTDDYAMYSTDQFADGTWSTPAELTLADEFWGGPVDAAHHAGHEAVVGTMIQPPCPCNTMYAIGHEVGHSWYGPDDLTLSAQDFDWPMSPCVQIQDDGTVHAFFYQVSSLEDMTPVQWFLVYKVRRQGYWYDESDVLSAVPTNDLGQQVALTVTRMGQPLFAFVSNGDVWAARPDHASPVPGHVPNVAPAMRVAPNPFNPVVEIVVDAAGDRPTEIAVLDARGRRIGRAVLHAAGQDVWRARWDGRDLQGRDLPSGTYLLAVEIPGHGQVTRKVTLAR